MSTGDEMNSKVKSKLKYVYIIMIIGVILDQLTKVLINLNFTSDTCSKCLSGMLVKGGKLGLFSVVKNRGIEIIPNFFYITKVENTGGAWGIFSNNAIALALISIMVIFLIHFFIRQEKELNRLSITYYGFLLAGIVGNLIDRLFNGYVTDFLNFYIFNYDYPVFNIADILIVVGLMMMVFDVIRGEINERKMRQRGN